MCLMFSATPPPLCVASCGPELLTHSACRLGMVDTWLYRLDNGTDLTMQHGCSPAFKCRKDLPAAWCAPAECACAQHECPEGVTSKAWGCCGALEQRDLAGLQAKVGVLLQDAGQLVMGGRGGHDVPAGGGKGVGELCLKQDGRMEGVRKERHNPQRNCQHKALGRDVVCQ
jgi:hypothetical protein